MVLVLLTLSGMPSMDVVRIDLLAGEAALMSVGDVD